MGWMGAGNNGQHGTETYTPYQDIGNRSIAAFLMAMGSYSYYGGGSETGIGAQACNMSDGAMHFAVRKTPSFILLSHFNV